ncbi:MAG TPA: ABC transporter ATP-binding protein [Opitutae bacterium]|nr:ABC transporter ATP-binding protein [Opitutae bacterium]
MRSEKTLYGPCCTLHIERDELAVRAANLSVSYQDAGHVALNGLHCEIPQGAFVAVVGPNGAGKSTLLKAIAGLLPFEGTLSVFGQQPGSCRHKIAYLAQRQAIDWDFPVSVEQLVLSGCYVYVGWGRRPRPQDVDKMNTALSLLELDSVKHRQISQLSGGQQQRALLARTLVHDPELFLLDEPLNAVDNDTRNLFHDCLKQIQAHGKTVLLATHDVGPQDLPFDSVVNLQPAQ